ncbi:T9SS type A sorting domain-containing protein [Luteibaculum oceani]|nr:T9SS type A sorting domain-containing protein [Luteibaculum oceani]
MKKLLFIAVCLACFALSTNAQTRYYNDVFTEVTVTSDVQYGVGLNAQNQSVDLFLDIYEPTGDNINKRIPIIVSHGGSFLPGQGAKTDPYIVDYANAMAKKGYVVFAITYRVGWVPNISSQEQSSRQILPAAWRAIQDYKSAVRFLRKTVAEDGNLYRIDGTNIIGAGFGAGGYLPTNMEAIDRGAELFLPELQQKNELTGQPNGTPYIDTTIQNLGGVAYKSGPNSSYDWSIPFIANYSGAVPTLKVFDTGDFPLIISVHSEDDEATPYRTDLVYASGTFPIIEVSGSYSIHEKLDGMGKNGFFKTENRDGYKQVRIPEDTPESNMYKKGLLTFPGEVYMWSSSNDTYDQNYDPTYKAWMDSVTTFSAARMQKWIATTTGIETVSINESATKFSVFPNPGKDLVTVKSNDFSLNPERIEFMDIAGRVALSTEMNSMKETINISNLKSGIYYIKVHANNKQYIHRFVKD